MLLNRPGHRYYSDLHLVFDVSVTLSDLAHPV